MFFKTATRLTAWRPGQLARSTFHAGLWNVVRVILQILTLVVLARTFGPDGYGRLTGTVSLYATVAQLVGFGSGIALVRDQSRKRDFGFRMRDTQRLFAVSGLAFVCLAFAAALWLLGAALTPSAFFCLALAEVGLAPLVLPHVYRYQAEQRMAVSGALLSIAPAARFLATVTILAMPHPDLGSFSIAYVGWMALAMGFSLAILHRSTDPAPGEGLLRTIRLGLPYAASSVTMIASTELDKTILLRGAGPMVAGHYSVAFRIMSAATLPINSLVLAAAPRLFQSTSRDDLFHRLIGVTLAYAVVAGLLMFLAAPLLPRLLGPDYLHSVPLLQGLCFVLVTSCVRQVVVAQLTAGDQQGARNTIELIGLATSVALILSLVAPLQSWAAIVAALSADLVVTAGGCVCLFRSPDFNNNRAR